MSEKADMTCLYFKRRSYMRRYKIPLWRFEWSKTFYELFNLAPSTGGDVTLRCSIVLLDYATKGKTMFCPLSVRPWTAILCHC